MIVITDNKMISWGKEPLNSPQEEEFSQAYINNGFNGRRAAITAGYSEKNADEQAQLLKKRPRVMKRIAFLSGLKLRQNDLTIDDFTRKLKEVANFDFRELYDKAGKLIPIPDLKPHVSRCLVAVDVSANGEIIKYRVEPAGKYIDLLGRYLTLIQDVLNRTDVMELQAKWDREAEESVKRHRKEAEELDRKQRKLSSREDVYESEAEA